MKSGPTSLTREVNWLGKATAQADDQALARVVQMLDGLKDRGAADQVLAQARQRLRALRPARPLGFMRVLFLPLDGAIIASTRWRRGEPLVPRSALAPLAQQVQLRLGPQAEHLANICAGHTTADLAEVTRLGAALWPVAAQSLPAAVPPAWEETGLSGADYAGIAALCRPLWQQGELIWAAMAAGPEGPPEALARAALEAVVPTGPLPLAAALAALVGRAASPGQVAMLAAQLDPQCRGAAQEALDRLLDTTPPQLDLLDLAGATAAAAALVVRLDDLEGCSLIHGERQRRLAGLRRAADEACRERFLAGVEAQLMLPAGQMMAAATVSDAAVQALENGARQLRGLEQVGRRLGAGSAYDKALATMMEALGRLAPMAGAGAGDLRRMDLARTVEILCGPDAAMRMLEASGG
jgi:hypothetical protein